MGNEELKTAIKEVLVEGGFTAPESKDQKKPIPGAVEIISDPSDRLLKSPKGEWDNLHEFALDVVRADRKGGRLTPKMERWHTSAMKVEGTSELIPVSHR